MSSPIPIANLGDEGTIPDSYIIILKSTVPDDVVEDHIRRITNSHSTRAGGLTGMKACGLTERFKFQTTNFQGYAGGFDEETLNEILESRDVVAWVEQDAIVTTDTIQLDSTWGLDRISHFKFPRDGTPPYEYVYNGETAGRGTFVYVLDTGIRVTHEEFEGRASWGYNAFKRDTGAISAALAVAGGTVDNPPIDDDTDDEEASDAPDTASESSTVPDDSNDVDYNGHGTHCAGTVGGKTYGVAKKTFLVAVKVLNYKGKGSWAKIIAGMNWVAQRPAPNVSAVSMSLGGRRSEAVNAAVDSLVRTGFTVVVSAGNKNDDAAKYSPASATSAITVAAINKKNKRASFSNYGPCVTLFSAGVRVLSASNASDTATAVKSGTSMSCPHVSGLAAYFISSDLTKANVYRTTEEIKTMAVQGQVIDPKDSPNLIAYNGAA
ncbi:Oryzin [Dactylella cylindrospora]|nr:Oryzin [Dactylella cylindrospora]